MLRVGRSRLRPNPANAGSQSIPPGTRSRRTPYGRAAWYAVCGATAEGNWRALSDKTTYIKFFAGVDQASVNALMAAVEQKLAKGANKVVVLISSPGGTVFHGLSAYNFLKGIPAEVVTHNFGSVDSMGVVLLCAGDRRLSVPHARFLLHGVQANFPQGAALEEKQLEERLKGLRIDIENIAGVIAATTGRSEKQVAKDMVNRTTLNPEQAVAYGLVHEISEGLLPAGAQLVSIVQT
jgi:ATP-dependent Clp protease protease subunit